jgi:hypothetical protein
MRTFCIRVIEKGGLIWGDIDDIILAERMPDAFDTADA